MIPGLDRKMTPAEWSAWLRNDHQKMTVWEFMAGCLARILAVLLETRDAAEHTEGMVGALDQFAAGLAERSGIPYATSGKVREALDRQRDDQRRQALADHQGA